MGFGCSLAHYFRVYPWTAGQSFTQIVQVLLAFFLASQSVPSPLEFAQITLVLFLIFIPGLSVCSFVCCDGYIYPGWPGRNLWLPGHRSTLLALWQVTRQMLFAPSTYKNTNTDTSTRWKDIQLKMIQPHHRDKIYLAHIQKKIYIGQPKYIPHCRIQSKSSMSPQAWVKRWYNHQCPWVVITIQNQWTLSQFSTIYFRIFTSILLTYKQWRNHRSRCSY